jgi:hypothetical protein
MLIAAETLFLDTWKEIVILMKNKFYPAYYECNFYLIKITL